MSKNNTHIVVMMDTKDARVNALGAYDNYHQAIGEGIMELSDYCEKSQYDWITIDLPKKDEASNATVFEAWADCAGETEDERGIIGSIWIIPTDRK